MTQTRVNICIATYKRPAQLERLLASLAEMEAPRGDVACTVVVIDNDAQESARRTVWGWSRSHPLELRYVSEARAGVSYVRNRALEESADADYLAFVDDDEMVSPQWLKALMGVRDETGAHAIIGPVEARYADGAPDWVTRADFHSKTTEVGGVIVGSTSNCLIDLGKVRELGLSFDTRLSLIGGEDTMFFARLVDGGGRLASAPQALVYETIPTDRATVKWLANRWRRTGYTDALIKAREGGEGMTRPRAAIQGLARIGAGGLATLGAVITQGWRRPEAPIARLYTFMRGCGMIAYAFGKPLEEYQRHEGSAGLNEA